MLEKSLRFINKTKKQLEITLDKKGPAEIAKIPAYCHIFENLLAHHREIRCITEVTPKNIRYCKKLLGLVSELRHLDNVHGMMATNESGHMVTSFLHNDKSRKEIFHGNTNELIAQGKYFFDILWKNAVPASKRIREIEHGIDPVKSQMIENVKEICSKMDEIITESTDICLCSSIANLHFSGNHYVNINKEIIKNHQNYINKGIRWITSISDKEDIDTVKSFTHRHLSIRHSSEIPPLNFIVTDKYFASFTEKIIGGEIFSNLLFSNDPLYVDQFSTIFNKTWQQSALAEDRIRELMDPTFFKAKIILDPINSLKVVKELYSSAKNEILIILPSVNGLLRIIKSEDLAKLNHLASKGITVKILIVQNQNQNDKYIKKLNNECSHVKIKMPQFDLSFLHGVIILDRAKTVIVKIKNDNTIDLAKAVENTTIMDGHITALSYASIFETIWNQAAKLENLKEINDELESNKKLQQEFFAMIAHELRNPIQPIIGMTEYLKEKIKDKRQIELLDSIINSGRRLNTLTENIIDVSHIEDGLFSIQKKRIDLRRLILETIKIYETFLKQNRKKIEFKFNSADKECFVLIDRDRIEQTLSNLFLNSIRSISRKGSVNGLISIHISKPKLVNLNEKKEMIQQVIELIIEDNGQGIDSKIMPHLFEKFKSTDGHGLGLYISRKIIEAHSGKIWVDKNKKDGSRFIFSLPLK